MRPVTILTPCFADETNTNAQNLSVKEIVARLDPGKFRVVMLGYGAPDPRLASRPNTEIMRWMARGNTARIVAWFVVHRPDVLFYPRPNHLDLALLRVKGLLHLNTAVVTHVVSGMVPGNDPLRRLIQNSDYVFGNSRFVSAAVTQNYGASAETIHNGIDTRVFFAAAERKLKNNRQLRVLYAGSYRPYKRVDVVIREAVRRPEVEFRLAGTGEEENNCRQLAMDLGCRNVQFLGHVPQAALAEEMRAADVFLFPSRLEGHPQVLGQAAACGLPSVALAAYQPDYVVPGVTGFLVESDAELSEKLQLLLSDSELRRTMGEAAIAHSRQFDWDQSARRWSEVLAQAAGLSR